MPIPLSSPFRVPCIAGGAVALALLLDTGCRRDSEPVRADSRPDSPPASSAGRSGPLGPLVDRVWMRSDSTGLPGVMRIFLSDSTLVMDSCWETYRLARWRMESDSALRWQEDATDISATIRSLSDKELVLVVNLREGQGEEQRYAAAPVPFLCPDMKR